VGFIDPGEWPMSATKVNKVVLRARAPEDFHHYAPPERP
jgi:hypothetical protein